MELFGMDELGLPSRLFETEFEPTGKRRVKNYFNFCWIEVIKSALKDENLAMLNASQFGQVTNGRFRMPSRLFEAGFEPSVELCI
ncbi:hypothetical protein Bca52824_051924 [Brassica carinata]|uniref:Uncharacterized protein n=1 Tax=Brassica carinata TaxID=52824 RepID=A0A8X7R8W0_BRACI|nr:hypothetical protein Bca52824_051924 [Brassica carinata]